MPEIGQSSHIELLSIESIETITRRSNSPQRHRDQGEKYKTAPDNNIKITLCLYVPAVNAYRLTIKTQYSPILVSG